jgi:hypothetical protein
LLDTGAVICHMTYGLWLDMGLDEVCFNELRDTTEFFQHTSFRSPKDMTFEKLPLAEKVSELGNNFKVKVYEFRLDRLNIGIPQNNSDYIMFENITVRLIDSPQQEFIVGWNVLKYLDIDYKPSINQSVCKLTLTEAGKALLHADRQNKRYNYMNNRFNYLQPDANKKI